MPPEDVLEGFEIVESELGASPSVIVPSDAAICDQCRQEIDGSGPRKDYAFTSCTRCGPRFGVIRQIPYDRARTGYLSFPACGRCQRELEDQFDRRFHAQTSCCPACGPRWWVCDPRGQQIGAAEEAWECVTGTLRAGGLVAVRASGGYQLICDALNQVAVKSLRHRKGRPAKPFAVLVRDLTVAECIGEFDNAARVEFESPANPIVIVRHRSGSTLAPAVTCGLTDIGLMAPSTGWHWLLLRHWSTPLVVTSGNREGESLITSVQDAERRLGPLADLFVHTDAPLETPQDDSVVRMIAGQPATIRLARGLAPWPLHIQTPGEFLAVGGHQKSAVALSNGSQALLGGHVGDLENLSTRARFSDEVRHLCGLYGVLSPTVLHDSHPGYHCTDWAHRSGSPRLAVPHHHAHVAAALIEHQLLDQPVLGLAFDGSGWGADGVVWGGEALVATLDHAERVAHLRPFALPGGELAIRQPWRVAAALLWQIAGPAEWARLCELFLPGGWLALQPLLQRVTPVGWERPAHRPPVPGVPLTTSLGRLFDGIASLVMRLQHATFEGEPAQRLESLASFESEAAYEFPLTETNPRQFDWRPMLRGIVADCCGGVPPSRIAARVHQAIADLCIAWAVQYPGLPVILSGGCFQNRQLCERIASVLPSRIHTPGRIPVNDGGLAAGQLAIGMTRTKLRS
ncbi:MAG: carbamoyltransferase HypF [Planctomycetaceae bacterium]